MRGQDVRYKPRGFRGTGLFKNTGKHAKRWKRICPSEYAVCTNGRSIYFVNS